jgi:hypothetical protein
MTSHSDRSTLPFGKLTALSEVERTHGPERSRRAGCEGSQKEDAMNFEEAGKLIDQELQKFVAFVEQKVRPKTRREMAELLRTASKNLTKVAQSLEKK